MSITLKLLFTSKFAQKLLGLGKTIKNTSISDLNDDILILVFSLSLPDVVLDPIYRDPFPHKRPYPLSTSLGTLTEVCKHWKAVIDQTPTLWSSFLCKPTVMPQAQLQKWMTKSNNTPLSFFLKFRDVDLPYDYASNNVRIYIQRLRRDIRRWRHVRLSLGHFWLGQFMAEFSKDKANSLDQLGLETLRIDEGYLASAFSPYYHAKLVFPDWARGIRTLHLVSYYFDINAFPEMNDLIELRVDEHICPGGRATIRAHTSPPFTTIDCLALMRKCQHLRTAYFAFDVSQPDLTPDQQLPPEHIPMQDLRTLALRVRMSKFIGLHFNSLAYAHARGRAGAQPTWTLGPFLEHLNLPALTRLELGIEGPKQMCASGFFPWASVEVLLRRSPRVEMQYGGFVFHMRGGEVAWDQAVGLLKRTPPKYANVCVGEAERRRLGINVSGQADILRSDTAEMGRSPRMAVAY